MSDRDLEQIETRDSFERDESLLGELAVRLGMIDSLTLSQAAKNSALPKGTSIGQILVESGSMTDKDLQVLEYLLDRQNRIPGQTGQSDPDATLTVRTIGLDDTNKGKADSDKKAGSTFFGDYEIIDTIAQGGMGIVYHARQRNLNREVALKTILGTHLNNESVKRFQLEAESAAKLDHPGIVPVYDFGQVDGQFFYSMALIDGQSLNELIKHSGPMDPVKAARLIRTTGEAVVYAHQQGLIHRDIKPHNILVDKNGTPRITDFGLAKQVQNETELTTTGQIMGTPSYMAPEQAEGQSDKVSEAADVYSLGATLYFLLAARPPFQASTTVETIRMVLESDPVPLYKLNPSVPTDLETIILKCLEKEPSQRYETASALIDDLDRWMGHRPILAKRTSRVKKAMLWCRRRPTLVGSIVTIIAICCIAVGLILREQNESRQSNLKQRAESNVNSVLAAPPEAIPFLLKHLQSDRQHALPRLRESFDSPRLNRTEKINAALALAALGEVNTEFLVKSLEESAEGDFENIVAALSLAPSEARLSLNDSSKLAIKKRRWQVNAQLAIAAMHLGDPLIAVEMCQQRPNPLQRAAFIEMLAICHGDLLRLAEVSRDLDDSMLRYAVALGIGSISVNDVSSDTKDSWQDVWGAWYREMPDSATHGAALYSLRQWNLEIPQLAETKQPSPDRNWWHASGVRFVRIPDRKVRLNSNGVVVDAKPFWLSDSEITSGLFQQFMDDKQYSGLKPVDWKGPFIFGQLKVTLNYIGSADVGGVRSPDLPIQQVSWYDAVMFCNWLSWKMKLQPYYRIKENPQAPKGKFAHDRYLVEFLQTNGIRLPSSSEWEFACLANAKTKFSFGDDESLLKDFAWYSINSNSQTQTVGRKRCTPWGLFDIHGNVWEWCRNGTARSRVHLGGCWRDTGAACQVTAAMVSGPAARNYMIGFRVAQGPSLMEL